VEKAGEKSIPLNCEIEGRILFVINLEGRCFEQAERKITGRGESWFLPKEYFPWGEVRNPIAARRWEGK